MKTLIVISAIAALSTAVPALLEKNEELDSRLRGPLKTTKRERKSLAEDSPSELLKEHEGLPESENKSQSRKSSLGLRRPVIVKKKFGYRLFRDSDEEMAQADPRENCRSQFRFKLCDEDLDASNRERSFKDEDVNGKMSQSDVQQSLKLAREAVESLQRDLEKIEQNSKLIHKIPDEATSELDDAVPRTVLDQNKALENPDWKTTLNDKKSEESRMAEWKEAIENIQKNVEISAKNIEDTFRQSSNDQLFSKEMDLTQAKKAEDPTSNIENRESNIEASDVDTSVTGDKHETEVNHALNDELHDNLHQAKSVEDISKPSSLRVEQKTLESKPAKTEILKSGNENKEKTADTDEMKNAEEDMEVFATENKLLGHGLHSDSLKLEKSANAESIASAEVIDNSQKAREIETLRTHWSQETLDLPKPVNAESKTLQRSSEIHEENFKTNDPEPRIAIDSVATRQLEKEDLDENSKSIEHAKKNTEDKERDSTDSMKSELKLEKEARWPESKEAKEKEDVKMALEDHNEKSTENTASLKEANDLNSLSEQPVVNSETVLPFAKNVLSESETSMTFKDASESGTSAVDHQTNNSAKDAIIDRDQKDIGTQSKMREASEDDLYEQKQPLDSHQSLNNQFNEENTLVRSANQINIESDITEHSKKESAEHLKKHEDHQMRSSKSTINDQDNNDAADDKNQLNLHQQNTDKKLEKHNENTNARLTNLTPDMPNDLEKSNERAKTLNKADNKDLPARPSMKMSEYNGYNDMGMQHNLEMSQDKDIDIHASSHLKDNLFKWNREHNSEFSMNPFFRNFDQDRHRLHHIPDYARVTHIHNDHLGNLDLENTHEFPMARFGNNFQKGINHQDSLHPSLLMEGQNQNSPRTSNTDLTMQPSLNMNVRDALEQPWDYHHPSGKTSYGAGIPFIGANSGGTGALGIFPNANPGCGIPLMLSCSPSVVSGRFAKPHTLGYTSPAYRSGEDYKYIVKRGVTNTNDITSKVKTVPIPST